MSHLNLSRSSGGGQRGGSSGEQGLERAGSGEQGAGSGIKHKEGGRLLFITRYYSVKKLM